MKRSHESVASSNEGGASTKNLDPFAAAVAAKKQKLERLKAAAVAAARSVPASVSTIIADNVADLSNNRQSSSTVFKVPPPRPPAGNTTKQAAIAATAAADAAASSSSPAIGAIDVGTTSTSRVDEEDERHNALASLLGYNAESSDNDSEASVGDDHAPSSPSGVTNSEQTCITGDLDKELAFFMEELESSGLLKDEPRPEHEGHESHDGSGSSNLCVHGPAPSIDSAVGLDAEVMSANSAEAVAAEGSPSETTEDAGQGQEDAEQRVLGYLVQGLEWCKVLDTGSNKVYYWNVGSGEVVWEAPAGLDGDLLLHPDAAGTHAAAEQADAVADQSTGEAGGEDQAATAPAVEGGPVLEHAPAEQGGSACTTPSDAPSADGQVPSSPVGVMFGPHPQDPAVDHLLALNGEQACADSGAAVVVEDAATVADAPAGPAATQLEELRGALLQLPDPEVGAVLASLAEQARATAGHLLTGMPSAVQLALQAELRYADWQELSAMQHSATSTARTGESVPPSALCWSVYEGHAMRSAHALLAALPAAAKQAAAGAAAASAAAAAAHATAHVSASTTVKPVAALQPAPATKGTLDQASGSEPSEEGEVVLEAAATEPSASGAARPALSNAAAPPAAGATAAATAAPYMGPFALNTAHHTYYDWHAHHMYAAPEHHHQYSSYGGHLVPPGYYYGRDASSMPLGPEQYSGCGYGGVDGQLPPLPTYMGEDGTPPPLPPPLPGAEVPEPPQSPPPPLPVDACTAADSSASDGDDMVLDEAPPPLPGPAPTSIGAGEAALEYGNGQHAHATGSAVGINAGSAPAAQRKKEYSAEPVRAPAPAQALEAEAVPVPVVEPAVVPPPVAAKAAVPLPSSRAAASALGNSRAKTGTSVGSKKPVSASLSKGLGGVGKVSALIGKWSAVKRDLQEEERKAAAAEEELFDVDAQARKKQKEIEAWRAKQLQSRDAEENANFQPVQGDWRKRLQAAGKLKEGDGAGTTPAATTAAGSPPTSNKTSKAHKSSKSSKSSKSKTKAREAEHPSNSATRPDLEALSKGLPAGWRAMWDKATGDIFYGNVGTRETAWRRPS